MFLCFDSMYSLISDFSPTYSKVYEDFKSHICVAQWVIQMKLLPTFSFVGHNIAI